MHKKDNVANPLHYQGGSQQTWDAILALGLGYLEGNIVKYVSRYKLKGEPLQDLLKARAYLDKLITIVEGGKDGPHKIDKA